MIEEKKKVNINRRTLTGKKVKKNTVVDYEIATEVDIIIGEND
jgi:hypothetical protein